MANRAAVACRYRSLWPNNSQVLASSPVCSRVQKTGTSVRSADWRLMWSAQNVEPSYNRDGLQVVAEVAADSGPGEAAIFGCGGPGGVEAGVIEQQRLVQVRYGPQHRCGDHVELVRPGDH